MRTSELIEKIEAEQKIISDNIILVFETYGWNFEDKEATDLKAVNTENYRMNIEDGSCPDVIGALIHIYCYDNLIFEGSVETPEEASILMKILSFDKIK